MDNQQKPVSPPTPALIAWLENEVEVNRRYAKPTSTRGHASFYDYQAQMLLAAADALRSMEATPLIACPECGEVVQQVASATLELALWQHWQWIHKAKAAEQIGVTDVR